MMSRDTWDRYSSPLKTVGNGINANKLGPESDPIIRYAKGKKSRFESTLVLESFLSKKV
jgi:hypothetical protein